MNRMFAFNENITTIYVSDKFVTTALTNDEDIFINCSKLKGAIEYEYGKGGKEYGLSNYPEFNSPKEVGDGFVDAGFNLVSLATNHTMDWYNSKGDALVVSSRDYWLDQYEKNGVISAGSYKSQEDKDNIVTGEVNNINFRTLSAVFTLK